jgi:hypothetical protein
MRKTIAAKEHKDHKKRGEAGEPLKSYLLWIQSSSYLSGCAAFVLSVRFFPSVFASWRELVGQKLRSENRILWRRSRNRAEGFPDSLI